jgi:hypothetical protein
MTYDPAGPPNNPAAGIPASPSDAGTSAPLRLGLALGLVVAAQFVLQLDFSIVNIALPTVKRELHFAPADLQWIVTPGTRSRLGHSCSSGVGSASSPAIAGYC